MAASTLSKPKVKLVCISDTHSKYGYTIPAGDILIHAGDFTMTGMKAEIEKFLESLKSAPYRLKIVIAGNHDLTLDSKFYESNWRRWHHSGKQDHEAIGRMMRDPTLASQYGIIYLEQQEFIDPESGLKFFGSPYQPEFCNWAFNLPRDSPEIESVWNGIPIDTDVLITHGPPANILDVTFDKVHAGCPRLLKRVVEVKPKLHVFGHIHEGYGIHEMGPTLFVNASTCNFRYEPIQAPIVVELDSKKIS